MGRTTELRTSIKAAFIPFMLDKGFDVDRRNLPSFLDFRKIGGGRVYVCDIQWEKYGRPRFALNFGSCGPSGVICHGSEIGPSDVTTSSTPCGGRLTARPGGTTRSWFRQDCSLVKSIVSGSRLKPAGSVVTELIDLFCEVEAFWSNGSIGPHIRILPVRTWTKDKSNT
jgi:hypothetical protein